MSLLISLMSLINVFIQGFPGSLRDNHTLNKIILVSLKGARINK